MLNSLRSLIATALIITGSAAAWAQSYTIKGVAADSTGVGESFATIRTYLLPDTVKPAAIFVTNEDGVFSHKFTRSGKYRLTLSSIGRAPYVREFSLSASRPSLNLDTLWLRNSGQELQEVVVTAQRPLVSREIDRIAYDVQNDPESSTTQLDEMLKKVPMVSVDPDGTINVKGSTSFQIYKNGRKSNSFSNNAKEIFKAIPASMIKKIEVITDPGAREDAEGVSTILNIVTIENTIIKGVMGTAGIDYNTNNNFPAPNIWLSSQINKVTFAAYANLYATASRSGHQTHFTERTFEDSENTSRETTTQKVSNTYSNVGFELSYDIDSLNLISGEFYAFIGSSKTRALFDYGMFDAADDLIYSYKANRLIDPSRFHWLGGNLNYQHLTHRKGEKIIFSYMISGNGNRSNTSNLYFDQFDMPVDYNGIVQSSNADFLEHTLQLNWTRPLTEHQTLDLGAKYIYRDNRSKSTQDYVDNRTVFNDFSHTTQVAAGFFDYRVNLQKFGFRAGLRYEFSRLAAKYHDGSNPDFHSTLNDWVPNAAISYSINDKNSMRLSYSTSIQRPGINYLNPTEFVTPETITTGNPDLSSVRNQSFNYNYSFFSSKVNVDFNASYSFSNNSIIQVMELLPGDIIYSNYHNAGKNWAFGSWLYVSWRPTNKTSFMLNGGANYNHYRNPAVDIRAGGWSGNLYFRYGQQLPWKLNLSLWVGYWSGYRSLYSKMEQIGLGAVNHGISLQRSFLKDNRLTVRLSASNPLTNEQRSRSHMFNVPYSSHSYSRVADARSFSIAFSYRFGSLNVQVKKINAPSNNDLIGGPSK